MGDKEDYLTSYRVFFENFAATVNPEDQLPVHIAGYTITEAELVGEVLYWTTQYLSEKQCPPTLMTPLRRIILDEVRVASKKTPNEFGYKSDEAVYIALRLMQAVTARVNDVCLRYLDNARLDTLPPPPPLAQRDLKTVSCATKNSRRVMEDRHVEIGNLEALFGIETTEPTSFYAVYDGHAGSAAATYSAAHLHQYLVESPHFTTDLRRAMRDAYLKTDAEFIRKSNQERACGGSTAVTVAVRGRRLLAAWAGDSLALLAKRMRLMQLVRPHKPGRQDERDRIESSGGTVMYWGTWRVNGQLAVSRAIGDAQYKPYVTARPEIATVELDGDEDFVVVACDGLWDFVSEDDVALSVYRQLAADPDDLKTVTKRLIAQAKRQGSADNISIIVVFLKDPRDIAADNRPPMDLGLDNAMMNVPPFTIETDVCKRQMDAAAAIVEAEVGECIEAEGEVEVGGNGVDNSDSDSEDLGPETAVDADDIDAEARHQEPQPPTPPAHTLEEGHVDGALVDNVAESGEDSEDEWNYYKGEGEREGHNPSEEPDEPPRSETPCQDNSAWENSSVDMNSSPLNPDAPVFVPGGVAGADVLLAESPRKPLPMDDIELPDVAQFETEAVVRPAELLDLDNCDQLNGHHNLSLEESVTQHLNGNDKCNMDSLGFGFNVGIEPDKVKDIGLIQDFERIQKDTTDFCNIQVFQTHADTNPFAVDDNDELFERLKNKERDPMSMSFYQEKDDDTCERLAKNELNVDLNAVQPLPDSDDDDIQQNGLYENEDKENVSPEEHSNSFDIERDFQEPNNDILRFDDRPGDLPQNVDNFGQGDNFVDYNVTNTNSIGSYSNLEFESNIIQDTVLQTDTPESHKLLFEQIPEIPDGKSSELGFTNDEMQDPSESEKEYRPFSPQDETSQDIEMESKNEDSPLVETIPQFSVDAIKDTCEEIECHQIETESNEVVSPIPNGVDIKSGEGLTPEPTDKDIDVEAHENISTEHVTVNPIELNENGDTELSNVEAAPEIKVDTDNLTEASNVIEDNITPESLLQSNSPLPVETLHHSMSPLPAESLLPQETPLSSESPMPNDSQLPVDELLSRDSPLPAELSLPSESPLPDQSLLQTENIQESVSPRPKESPLPSQHVMVVESPLPAESPLPDNLEESVKASNHVEDALSPVPKKDYDSLHSASPMPTDASLPSQSPMPQESQIESTEIQMATISPMPSQSPLPSQSPIPCQSPLPTQSPLPAQSPLPSQSPLPLEPSDDIVPLESPLPVDTEPVEDEDDIPNMVNHPVEPATSPLPADVPLPGESPLPADELAVEVDIPIESVSLDDVVKQEAFGELNSVVQPDTSRTDLAEDAEALLDVDAPVKLDAPEEPDVALSPDMSSVPSESPVEPEVLMEPAKPEAVVEEARLIESEVIVDTESHIESKVPIEAESLEEASVPMEAEVPVTAELPVEAEVEVEAQAPVAAEVPVQTDVPMENEDSGEAEGPKEDHSSEIDVTNQAITVADTELEQVPPVASELETVTAVEPELETVTSVESALTVEFTAPAEPAATIETETAVEAIPLEISAPLEVLASEEHHPVAMARSPTPTAPVYVDNVTSECMSPPPVADLEARLTPDVSLERMTSSNTVSAPAPDLLPEEPVLQARVELITDVDIGIPESRAQEICVPVTSEIQLEEAVQPPTATTPPPTPAVEPSSATLDAAPISDTPIAGEATLQGVEVAAAAVAAAGMAAGIAAIAKTKATTTKKSPTTKPDVRTAKTAPKTTTTARTPATTATTKKPASAGPTSRTPTATKTPSSAPKTPITATRTTPTARTPTATSKPSTPITKSAAPTTKTTPATKPSPQTRAPATARPAPSKPTGVAAKPAREAPATARTATATNRAAPATRPALKASVPKSDTASKTTAARPASRPATAAAKPPAKTAERKPLTNGDVKDAKAPTRPAAPKAAPTTRPAPRPMPRAPASVPAPATKTSAPKPLPRATPLDKQSKDLANKRITAKAAPPRTAPSKTAALSVKKAVPKRAIESVKKEAEMNGLVNGDAVSKPPPSPPAADNALLPDVIA